MRRSSSSAPRPVTSTARSASNASAGRAAAILRPTPAWKVTTLSVWATTSCSSRAIRTRSSRTARQPRSASCCSRRAASSVRYLRRSRTLSPTNHSAPAASRLWAVSAGPRAAAAAARSPQTITSSVPISAATATGRRELAATV